MFEKSIFLSELAIKFVEFCEIIDCSCTMIYRIKGGMICFSNKARGSVIRAELVSKKKAGKLLIVNSTVENTRIHHSKKNRSMWMGPKSRGSHRIIMLLNHRNGNRSNTPWLILFYKTIQTIWRHEKWVIVKSTCRLLLQLTAMWFRAYNDLHWS